MLKETIEQLKKLPLRSIYLKGSYNDPETLDYWSDLDLLLVVDQVHNIEGTLDQLYAPIIAKQVFRYDGGITYRVLSGYEDHFRQYDFQILDPKLFLAYQGSFTYNTTCVYGLDESKAFQEEMTYQHFYDIEIIDDKWFCFYEIVKKFARDDRLIAYHLLLDLIQTYLVLSMVDRDILKGSHIHRRGDKEKIPEALNINMLTESTRDILKQVLEIAKLYDQKLLAIHPKYKSRIKVFDQHIKTSIKLILNH